MSDPTTIEPGTAAASSPAESAPLDRAPRDVAPRPFLAPMVGAFVALVGLSSLLDETGLVANPAWLPIALGITGIALAIIARTVERLLRPDGVRR